LTETIVLTGELFSLKPIVKQMTAKSKKFSITTENHEIFILRRNRNKTIRGFCPDCQKEVEMLTLDEATTKTGKRTRELFELIENNSLHSIETGTGHLLICLKSLTGV
jgi:uncharacterized protein YlaI